MQQSIHTVNSGPEMVEAKPVSGKNIYWSTCIGKSKERKNVWLPTLSFWATSQTAPASQPIGLDFMVHVSPALKRTMYEFKNFSSPAFSCQSRPKYIFSRDMFCLYYFWAWIHGVYGKRTCWVNNQDVIQCIVRLTIPLLQDLIKVGIF